MLTLPEVEEEEEVIEELYEEEEEEEEEVHLSLSAEEEEEAAKEETTQGEGITYDVQSEAGSGVSDFTDSNAGEQQVLSCISAGCYMLFLLFLFIFRHRYAISGLISTCCFSVFQAASFPKMISNLFFFFFFCVPQLYLWGSPLLGEICTYVTIF